MPTWAVDALVGGVGAMTLISVAHAALPTPTHSSQARPAGAAQRLAAAAKTPPQPAALITFARPVADYPIISPFGLRQLPWEEHGRLHAGVDIAAPSGTPVKAVADGVVTRAGEDGGFGRFVEIRHAEGLVSIYAHLGAIAPLAHPGALIRMGEPLGQIGSTGSSTGAHLHFEIRGRDDRPLNPVMFMDQHFATAADLPLQAAARVPRSVRIAYVSYIPKSKREMMEAREADETEAVLSKAQAGRAQQAAKAAAETVAIFPGAELAARAAAPKDPAAAAAASAPVKREGRVHASYDMEG